MGDGLPIKPENLVPCGKCCHARIFYGVLVTAADYVRKDDWQVEPRESFMGQKISPKRWEAGDRVLKILPSGHCPYLSEDRTRCTVYENRPDVCRAWTCTDLVVDGDPPEYLCEILKADGLHPWMLRTNRNDELRHDRDAEPPARRDG